MRRLFSPIPVAAVLVLSACASAPEPLEPVAVPDTFGGDAGEGRPDPDTMARWWGTFEDPLLSEFVATALKRNLDLRLALAEMQAARAQLRQARLALYPGLDVPAEASRQWMENPLADAEGIDELAAGLGLEGDTITMDNWQVLLQAQWQPDIFGAGRSRREAARLQYGATQARAMAVRLSIAAGVAEAYVQARSLIAQSRTLDELLDVARDGERVTRALFQLGETSSLDIAAAAAERAALEARRGDLEAGLAQTAFAMDTLLDLPPGTVRQRLGERDEIPVADTRIPLGQPFEMLMRRPDVIAVSAGLQAAELAALASRRELFPQLSLVAAAGRSGSTIGDLGSSQSSLATVAAQLTFPWLIPANHAAVEIADAERGLAFVQLRQAVATALEEVEAAAAQIEARERQKSAVEEAIEWAEERLAHARRSYEVGHADLGQVLEAQQGLLDARQAHSEARLALANAQIALYTALGGGWHPPEGIDEAALIPERIGVTPPHS